MTWPQFNYIQTVWPQTSNYNQYNCSIWYLKIFYFCLDIEIYCKLSNEFDSHDEKLTLNHHLLCAFCYKPHTLNVSQLQWANAFFDVSNLTSTGKSLRRRPIFALLLNVPISCSINCNLNSKKDGSFLFSYSWPNIHST